VTQVSKAKDFPARQITIQAALEDLPLSDVEKRMMYFTEGPDPTEDPAQLNDDFEAEYEWRPTKARCQNFFIAPMQE
jgi:hypothetical protein